MKGLISLALLTTLCIGCQQKEGVSLNEINWKIGQFTDLEKEPVAVILTNTEPSLIYNNLLYKEDYSERAKQIIGLIKSADEEVAGPEDILPNLPEQLWIAFEDGTGSVFPYLYNAGSPVIIAGKAARCSERLGDFLEWLHVHQIDRQPKKDIVFEKIKWRKGKLSDLNKKATGLVISKAVSELDFNLAKDKEDFSEEAARIAFLFGHDSERENYPFTNPMQYQMWIAFEDGTGSVFECDTELMRNYTIKADDGTWCSQSANEIMDLVRYRNLYRKEINETGKVRVCPKADWERGSLSDLEKTAHWAIVTYESPYLGQEMNGLHYQLGMAKKKEIFDVNKLPKLMQMIKDASIAQSALELSDQIWIFFTDGTQCLFPFLYNRGDEYCYIKIENIVKYSPDISTLFTPKQYAYGDPNFLGTSLPSCVDIDAELYCPLGSDYLYKK